MNTNRRYTGQFRESSLGGVEGLYYFNARWVDVSLARFAQADSIIPDPGNPQAWDRFAYGLNNSIRYTDPTGHLACSDPNVAEGDCSDESVGLWRYGVSLSCQVLKNVYRKY
jgi:RHS repeat-associated protein